MQAVRLEVNQAIFDEPLPAVRTWPSLAFSQQTTWSTCLSDGGAAGSPEQYALLREPGKILPPVSVDCSSFSRGPNFSPKFPNCVSTIHWLIYIYFLPAVNCFCTLLISSPILLTVGMRLVGENKVPSRENCPSGSLPTLA